LNHFRLAVPEWIASVDNRRGVVAILVTEKIVPFHFIFVMVSIKVVLSESMKGTSFVLFLDR
jgi:hypothetical protein